jgi:hypothetical protein
MTRSEGIDVDEVTHHIAVGPFCPATLRQPLIVREGCQTCSNRSRWRIQGSTTSPSAGRRRAERPYRSSSGEAVDCHFDSVAARPLSQPRRQFELRGPGGRAPPRGANEATGQVCAAASPALASAPLGRSLVLARESVASGSTGSARAGPASIREGGGRVSRRAGRNVTWACVRRDGRTCAGPALLVGAPAGPCRRPSGDVSPFDSRARWRWAASRANSAGTMPRPPDPARQQPVRPELVDCRPWRRRGVGATQPAVHMDSAGHTSVAQAATSPLRKERRHGRWDCGGRREWRPPSPRPRPVGGRHDRRALRAAEDDIGRLSATSFAIVAMARRSYDRTDG